MKKFEIKTEGFFHLAPRPFVENHLAEIHLVDTNRSVYSKENEGLTALLSKK
jgi:hypothetical protein